MTLCMAPTIKWTDFGTNSLSPMNLNIPGYIPDDLFMHAIIYHHRTIEIKAILRKSIAIGVLLAAWDTVANAFFMNGSPGSPKLSMVMPKAHLAMTSSEKHPKVLTKISMLSIINEIEYLNLH